MIEVRAEKTLVMPDPQYLELKDPVLKYPDFVKLPSKVAMLTAGGLAPCLSSAVGGLIERYNELYPSVEMIMYVGGYKGLLLGESLAVTPEVRRKAGILHLHGGSPIGNSRVKLTNIKDCINRGLITDGQDPQQV